MIELLLQAERALEMGRVDAADTLYRQVAAADPRNAIAVVGLARVALERGDDLGAYLTARRALSIDKENSAAARMVERLAEVMQYRGDPVPQVGGGVGGGGAAPGSDAETAPVQRAPGLVAQTIPVEAVPGSVAQTIPVEAAPDVTPAVAPAVAPDVPKPRRTPDDVIPVIARPVRRRSRLDRLLGRGRGS